MRGIIHALAPEAEIVSVRVLGPDNRGNGGAFATGLWWTIEQSGASVANLSLSSRSDAFFGPLHELADEAYFRNVLLVAAANNVSVASYPSLYAAVVSVAAHDLPSADAWFYNPAPPVEFGGYGLNVDVAWRGGTRMVVTGNSFAAPHIAGYATRIRAAHPGDHPVRDQGDPGSDRGQRPAQPVTRTAGPKAGRWRSLWVGHDAPVASGRRSGSRPGRALRSRGPRRRRRPRGPGTAACC